MFMTNGKNIVKRLDNFWATLRAGGIMAWRSLVIILRAKYHPKPQEFITRYTHEGAVKVLKAAKVHYTVRIHKSFKKLTGGRYILMSNHLSLMDLPLIFATIPGAIRPLAKKNLFHMPIFGAALKAGLCIPVDLNEPMRDVGVLLEAAATLEQGTSILIFPEGRRSLGQILPFKPGGFRLAREIGAKIIPIGIRGTEKIMPFKKIIISTRQKVEIHIGEMIDANEYKNGDGQKLLMQRVKDAIIQLINEEY